MVPRIIPQKVGDKEAKIKLNIELGNIWARPPPSDGSEARQSVIGERNVADARKPLGAGGRRSSRAHPRRRCEASFRTGNGI
jgi:hypothetical protein